MAALDRDGVAAGIREEARRADAAAADRTSRFQSRFSLRHMFTEQNQQLVAAAGPAAHLLEVGAGVGTFLVDAMASPAIGRLVGLEVSPASARAAQTACEHRVAVVVAPAEQLPFADEVFDVVVARGVLHHLSAPAAAIAEMRRVLRPGGRLVIFEGNPASRFRRAALGFADLLRIEHEDTQYRHLWPDEIRELLGGFSRVHATPVNGLFAPLAYVGVGGPGVWRLLDGIRGAVKKVHPSGFAWWLLWTAVR